MTTDFTTIDWRAMSREEVDRGLNNGAAVAASADIIAGWEKRSAVLRQQHPHHLDVRYGPRERNRIDFLKAADRAPTLLFIHGGYWRHRAKEVFTVRRPDGARHQCCVDRLHAGAGCDAG
jgi:arylformamidase